MRSSVMSTAVVITVVVLHEHEAGGVLRADSPFRSRPNLQKMPQDTNPIDGKQVDTHM